MNEVVALSPRPQLSAGARPTAIVPTDMDSCYRLAKAVCIAGMAPKGLDTPEKAMVAIMHGLEVGLTPMAALQRIAVVNGRPTIWGDGAIGLVRGSGLCEYVKEWTEGECDKRTAFCEAKRKGEPSSIVRTFSVADAKRAGLWGKAGPWQQYPERMLPMRARAFCLRDLFADVLGGLYLREEIEDDAQGRRAPPAPPTAATPAVEYHQPDAPALEAPRTRRAPPPPPQAEPAASSIDISELQEQFANALAFSDSEDSANAAYTMLIGPVENDLAPADLDALLRMLSNRICEIVP